MTPAQVPLPAVPDTLRTPAERASYVSLHFLDSIKWDCPAMTSAAALEQTWANFLSVLSLCDDSVSQSALDKYIHAFPDSLLDEQSRLAELYLYSTASPVANERCYLMALSSLATSPHATAEMREMYAARLEYLGTAAPGTQLPAIEDADGQLLASKLGQQYTLIVVKSSTCHFCHELMHDLATDDRWLLLQRDGKVKVVAVEQSDVIDDLLPHHSVPAVYLVDSQAVVVERNISLDKAYEVLQNLH